MRIFLIGFMGSGKSWMGKKIAATLKIPFYDIDEVVEEKAGLSVAEIFSNEGEDYFRQLESEALTGLPDEGIVATGGGIVESEENREFLKQPENIVIWLHPDWEIICRRIEKSNRPKLQNSTQQEWYALWEKRLPFYEESATHVLVDCEEPELRNFILRIL